MNNLVIGNTSQLSYYFPDNYIKISSRNIDFDYHTTQKYDRIYLCFAEQRTYLLDNIEDFMNINYDYTIKVIDKFEKCCNQIIFYSTCELWNNCNGPIDIDDEYDYNYSPYIKSKEMITEYIKEHYDNVIVLYPFNFNSPYRRNGFLFGKIFDSIINDKKIEIGNTYFYRDLVHPKYVVERSILCDCDELIGSGRLTYINDFIRELYDKMNMSYEYYVNENINNYINIKRQTFWKNTYKNEYKKLVEDIIYELKKIKYTTS